MEIMIENGEKLGLVHVAVVLRKAYVDYINWSVKTEEQAKVLKTDLPKHTENFNFHLKGMVINGENPPETLSSNAAVAIMGYAWISQNDMMKSPSNPNGQDEEGQVYIQQSVA